MRFSPIILAISAVLAGPAMAAGTDEGAVVVLDAATCRSLVGKASRSAPAEYQPGVDVRGNPVAPADLPKSGGSVAGLPSEISIDLRMSFADLLGAKAPARMGQSMTNTGRMTIDTLTGRTMINGEPIVAHQKEADDKVLSACRDFLARQK